MGDTQTYSHFDIQRYLQRKMSPKEMHEFERALMDDPFLADAIEGFSDSDQAVAAKHLLEIESGINAKNEKAKVVPLVVRKTGWWKVAAVVLVVTTGAALSYSILNKKEGNSTLAEQSVVAKTRESETLPDSIGPAEKPVAKIDILPSNDLAANKQVKPPSQNSPLMVSEQRSENEGTSASGSLQGRTPGVSITNADEQASPSLMAARSAARVSDTNVIVGYGTQARVASAQPQLEFKGKVVDKTGEPLPFASVRVNNSDIGAIADAKGNFTLRAPDSVIQVKVKSAGYAVASAEVKSNTPVNKIIVEEDNSSLADVVITNIQSKKEKKLVANSRAASSAEPEGGWKTFDEYMKSQMDSLRAEDDEMSYDQDVVLEFSIDKQGRPTNIKTAAPAEKKVADKVKQILSRGPKWKNAGKERRVKVIIPF